MTKKRRSFNSASDLRNVCEHENLAPILYPPRMAQRKAPGSDKDPKTKASLVAGQPANQQSDKADEPGGAISAAQRDQLKAIFKQVDRNKDGYIDKNDLGQLMQRLNFAATKAELEEMIKAQKNANSKAPPGHLDFNEFCDMMQRNRTQFSLTFDADISQLFNTIDRNKDGKISMPELRESMRASIGSTVLSERDIHEMFRSADTNHDGFISFDEFASLTTELQQHEGERGLRQERSSKAKSKQKQQSKKPSPK